MYQITSKSFNSNDMIHTIRTSIGRVTMLIGFTFLALKALPENDYIIEMIINGFYVIVILYILTIFYTFLTDRGRDYSGQFIRLDDEKIEVKEMTYSPYFSEKRDDYFVESTIYFEDIDSIEVKYRITNKNLPNSIIITLEDNPLRSRIAEDINKSVNSMIISEYGYDYSKFLSMISLIQKKFNQEEIKVPEKEKTIDDVIEKLSSGLKFESQVAEEE